MRTVFTLMLLGAGIAMTLGGLGHSLEGIEPVRAALEKQGVAGPIGQLIVAVWHFGGASMIAFGLLVLVQWRAFRIGRNPGRFAQYLVAALYLVYGAWAVAFTGSPFFWTFFGLGLIVLVSCQFLSMTKPDAAGIPPASS